MHKKPCPPNDPQTSPRALSSLGRKSRVSRVALIASPIVLAAVLAGCGHPLSSTRSTPRYGGTAVVALAPETSPNWWFPVISSADYGDSNFQMNVMMYVPLIHVSKTDGIDYARSLATSVTYNSTGTLYQIHLNHKWHWSNGTPVTSQDVVFTWDVLKAASSNLPGASWAYGGAGSGGVPARWTSVRAAGPYTVDVTLNTPTNPNWFIHNGLAQIVPVPKSTWDKHPHNLVKELAAIQSLADSPNASEYRVVDGAYHFQSMQANNNWTFVPNPRYDGHRSTLSKVIYQYETSPEAEFLGLQQGTINVGYLPTSEWNARTQLTRDTLTTPYVFGFTFLQPNYNSKAPGGLGAVFQHLYVRQALEMGINQPAIIRTFYHQKGVLEADPIPPEPQTVFYDRAVKPTYAYNPAAGKALLEAHGWHDVKGVMTRGTTKLSFTLLYISGSHSAGNMVQLIKEDWAQEGVQVALQSGPFDQVLTTAQQADPTKWTMAFWGTQSWTYEPDYYPTGGSFYLTGAGANQGGYHSPTMDQLIRDSYLPGTPTQIKARLNQYVAYAAHDLPVLWLPYTPSFNEHANTIHGVVRTYNPITTFYSPNYWTITK